MFVARIVCSLLLGVVSLATLIPLIHFNRWFVRMLDPPRLHYLVLTLVLTALVGLMFLFRDRDATRSRISAVAALVLGGIALVVQVVTLGPYRPQTLDGPPCAEEDRLVLIAANVKLGNETTEPLIAWVREIQPDVLLTMETDETWDRALSALDGLLPNGVQEVTGSYYGIHLQSRLPITTVDVAWPAGSDTPVIQVDFTLGSGELVRFVGIHPKPPHWSQPSVRRDGQLLMAALRARESDRPTLIAGDFNAVPWEPTFRLMQRVGRLLDPRVRRGFLATHSADSWWMYWPLDHVLHQNGLRVTRMEVGPDIASDHYPLLVELCADGTDDQAPELNDDDLEDARAAIEAARELESRQETLPK